METFFFFPPLKTLTGGMAVLLSMVKHLNTIGYKSTLVLKEPPLSNIDPSIPTIYWNDVKLTKKDIWVIPEGWPMALTLGLQAHSQCIVYVQNWAYLHENLPPNITWSQLPISMIAVSGPVAFFIQETTAITPQILRPGIDPDIFYPQTPHKLIIDKSPIRIAWMPRKNKALAQRIQQSLIARLLSKSSSLIIEWVDIHKKTQKEVATLLRNAHIFLATGFPEGCPLPPLEALACGCLVVGFGGMGGWDYMRQALPNGYTPWWPLENVTWGGNGLYTADADILGATFALEYAIQLLSTESNELKKIRLNARKTAEYYSLKNHQATLTSLWKQITM